MKDIFLKNTVGLCLGLFCACLGMIFLLAGNASAQNLAPSDAKETQSVSVENLRADEAGKEAGSAGGNSGSLISIEKHGIDGKPGSALYSQSSMFTMLKNFFIFIVLLVALYFVLKGLGKMSRFRGGKGQTVNFKMQGVLPLDNRKYLAAVEVDGRILVIGVSQDRISPLAQWPLNSPDCFTQQHSDFKEELKHHSQEDSVDTELDISVVEEDEK